MDACVDCLGVQHAQGGFWENLFSTDFVARAECIGQRPDVIWLHVLSDGAIMLAYYSIPLALWYFVRKRRDLAFPWMFLLFAGFILACGTTHLFNILAFWYPMYRLDGVIKAGTGAISIVTAAMLWPLVPKAVALVGPGELRAINVALQKEVVERRKAESALATMNERLEEGVQQRTRQVEEASRALAERLAELEAVFQTAAVGLCQVDMQWRVSRASARFFSLVKLPAPSVIGHALKIVCPVLAEGAMAAVKRVSDGASGEALTPTVLHVKQGDEKREWLLGINAVKNDAGQLQGYSIAVKDVTAHARMEEQLSQSQKMEAIGQLASGVAHDINNTLTAVYGYLSVVRAQIGGNHAAEASLDKIASAAEQTARMTKALLTFAKPSAAKQDHVELSVVLGHALSLVRGSMPARIEISEDIAASQGVWIYADPTQIQQVLLNLAINARDAMPQGGRLRITTTAGTDAVQLVVADTGNGIPAEILPLIFDPFFTTKPRGEGTGLGLSIVRGVITAHRGQIEVESTAGKGTKFTVTLPRVSAPEDAMHDEVTPMVTAAKGATAILADDNTNVRELLALQMRKGGYNVLEARDGPELVEVIQRAAGTAVIYVIDVDMPGQSGLDCLRQLRERGDYTPVVLISGGKEHEMQNDGRVAVLSKPFTGSELLRAMSALLSGQYKGGK